MAGAESPTGCPAELEPVVSLVDVLEEDEELENEACAVLGGSDPEKCSYSQVRAARLLPPVSRWPQRGRLRGGPLLCASTARAQLPFDPQLVTTRAVLLSCWPYTVGFGPGVVASWWPAFHESILVTS